MKLHALAAGLAISIHLVQAYSGDMTYYAPGVGSCGIASQPTDDIVALSVEMMANGADPNANPKCNTQITIWNPTTGQAHTATVVDTCQGCKMYDIDVTQSLFAKVAPNGNGRVQGIDWGGNAIGG